MSVKFVRRMRRKWRSAAGALAGKPMPAGRFGITLDPNDGFCKPDFFGSLELEVDCVIDVGVQRGTDWLYKSFPKAKFLLVDPHPGGEEMLHSPPESYKFIEVGLSGSPGKAVLDLRGPRSSLNEWSAKAPHQSAGKHEVSLITLDQLIEAEAPTDKIGLKIDTEGHECQVISGLDNYRENIQFLVCESSIRKRFQESYRFSELIALLSSKGFELYNFVSPQIARPTHYDCIFLPTDHELFSIGV
ncbi:FkbM family methyltransferase [Halioglobus maricola]|uniref:FkbM family methyltransferase n=1 Tax=Halioglobus maricola TaxID=2601894 RepID=A0A5P9NFC6_9GAMM|nr:FkbM family methyltransferase [Halioglobus maricola]QFU74472.1 FkbM family methyltransferase [Halioglobus maricola]